MKLFLDDTRDPEDVYDSSEGWVVVRTYREFRIMVENWADSSEKHLFISFDHDLGSDQTGLDCAHALTDMDVVPDGYKVHSANPVGAKQIRSFLRSWEQHKAAVAGEDPQEAAMRTLTWYSRQIGLYD